MAETQRRTARDKAEMQIKAEDVQMSNKAKMDTIQSNLIINTEKNLTAERIKSAEISRDAAQLQHEQLQTVLDAQNQIQSNLGENQNV